MLRNENLAPIMRGDNISFLVTITEGEVPVDITGDEVIMTLKLNPSDPDIIAAMQSTADLSDGTGTAAGIAPISFSPEQTDVLASTYNYDVQWRRITSGNGEINTVLYGRIEVLQHVTHSGG